MKKQMMAAGLSAAVWLAMAAAGSAQAAPAAVPTNTMVGLPTWTVEWYPTSTTSTNTPVPILGEPWYFGPRVFLPSLMR